MIVLQKIGNTIIIMLAGIGCLYVAQLCEQVGVLAAGPSQEIADQQ